MCMGDWRAYGSRWNFPIFSCLKRWRRSTLVAECSFGGSSVDGVICCCRMMECEAIPCAHMFVVLDLLDVDTIPRCCVSKRWTMEAKAAFVSVRNANTHVWSAEMRRYRDLRNKAMLHYSKLQRAQSVCSRLWICYKTFSMSLTTIMRTPKRHHLVRYSSTILHLAVWGEKEATVPKGAPSKKRMKPVH